MRHACVRYATGLRVSENRGAVAGD